MASGTTVRMSSSPAARAAAPSGGMAAGELDLGGGVDGAGDDDVVRGAVDGDDAVDGLPVAAEVHAVSADSVPRHVSASRRFTR